MFKKRQIKASVVNFNSERARNFGKIWNVMFKYAENQEQRIFCVE